MDPVADARAPVSERFPAARAAFLGGGVLSDRRTTTSGRLWAGYRQQGKL